MITETEKLKLEAPETILNTLRKVRMLAERGIEGERLAAQQKLTALLRKYGISQKDLETPETKLERHLFSTPNRGAIQLLMHTASFVTGRDITTYWHAIGNYKSITIELSTLEFADVSEAYQHYLKILREMERDILKEQSKARARIPTAIIQKFKLFAPENSTEPEQRHQMTRSEIYALMAMMENVKGNPWERPLLKLEGCGHEV